MAALNKVQLIGYLGKDPEMRKTSNDKHVTSFSLGVTRRWRSKSGDSQSTTDWFNIETWGRLAEICNDYLSKGRLVYVEGRLQTDRYEQEGSTRFFTKIVANEMQILDRRPEEEEPVEEEQSEEK
jgi:single-strand DNA-binding protein